MSKYHLVSALETQTEEQFNTRMKGNHPAYIDGFVDALRKAMPNLKFRCPSTFHTEVAVYREGDAVAMGWIAYGDYTPSDKVSLRYTVCSPNIDNGKYRKESNQRQMAMTTDLDKAVKLAKKFMRPIATRDVATDAIGDLNSAFQNSHNDTMKRLVNSRNAIIGYSGMTMLPNALEYALATFRMQGLTIGDADFNNTVNTYFEAKDAFIAATQFTGSMYFVHPHMRMGIPTYEAIPITWDQISTERSLPRFKVAQPSTARDEILLNDMEAIKGRVAVLHMMQTAEFVHDVGMKLDNARYFVVV